MVRKKRNSTRKRGGDFIDRVINKPFLWEKSTRASARRSRGVVRRSGDFVDRVINKPFPWEKSLFGDRVSTRRSVGYARQPLGAHKDLHLIEKAGWVIGKVQAVPRYFEHRKQVKIEREHAHQAQITAYHQGLIRRQEVQLKQQQLLRSVQKHRAELQAQARTQEQSRSLVGPLVRV